MFSNWTIARKIHGVIAVGLVSLCAIGGLAYTTTGQLIRNAGWVTHTHEVLDENNEILSLLKDAETGQRGYLITGEQQYLEPFNQSKGSIRSTMERIKRLTADNPAQQARLAELEGLIGEKFNELQDTIDLRTNTGFDAARDVVLTDKGKQVMDNIRKKLAEVERDERTLLQQRSDDAHKSASTTQAVTLWGTLACLALSSSLAFFVIRGVTNVLLRSVKELTSGAEQLSGAAAQVSSASQALAQGSSEQAASLEETSASTEQINSMARRNSESSRSAADLVLASQQKFTETSRSLEQMVAAMEEINASSGRISMIIKTIDEIAFQTNILALNAAVESARAGEAGMGFAVVADEVRNLAQRCAQAAKDTAGLIEESIARSHDGKKKVDQVAEAIRVMSQSSAQIKTLVDDVNVGSHEQAQGIEQVARAIAQMEQVTQNTAETAEESASAAEELTAQSETLRTIVASLNTLIDGADRTEHRIAESAATR